MKASENVDGASVISDGEIASMKPGHEYPGKHELIPTYLE